MSGKKIITVFGATGQQGGSIVTTFLNDPKLKDQWTVRGVTRDATKPAAKKLESQGAEVVTADLNEEKTIAKAVEGSYAVFAVTNYWEKLDMKLEIQQGKNMVDAAKAAGVKLFIWSSLLNVTELSKGKLAHVYHFDGKAEVEAYARKEGVPSVFFMPGMYMTAFPGGMFRKAPPNDAWTIALPVPATAAPPLFYTGDTGKWVKAIALNADKLLGKRVLAATKYYSFEEMLAEFREVYPEAGKTAAFKQVPADAFKDMLASSGMPGFAAGELLENHLLVEQFGYFGGASLDESHALLEDPLTTWKDFIKSAPAFKDLK